MALATLSIDLEARLAKLQEGLDRAGRLAEKESARIGAAFAGTQKALVGIGTALAGAFSVSVITQFTRATIDGIDALNDFADAVGTSVENASALEDVAVRTGTTLDTVTAAALKLNQTLGDAKPGSNQAKALEAIGLSAKELRALDPADALLEVATALGTYTDGGNKARLIQELFGKSVREVAPFLKDLAEQGRLNATVTSEQARAAEAFNKQLFELRKNFTDAARGLVGELIPALSRFFKEFAAGRQAFGGTGSALLNLGLEPTDQSAFQRLDFYREKVAKLRAELDGIKGINAVFNANRAGKLNEDIREAEQFIRYYETLTGTGRRPANEGGGGLRSRLLPDISSATAESGGKGKVVDDYLSIYRRIAEGEEEFERDKAEAWQIYNQQKIEIAEEAAEAQKKQWAQVFQFIDDEQERAIAEGRAMLEADTKKVSTLADELGLTFTSAFEDAIVGGKGLRDVLRGLEQDILRIVTRKLVTEPLGGAITDFLKGFGGGAGIGSSVGSFFSSLFSGFFAEGGFIPPGRWGVTGERGPEAVFGGRTGATVVPAGGRSIVVNVAMPAGADRRTGEQFGAQIAQQLARASARNN